MFDLTDWFVTAMMVVVIGFGAGLTPLGIGIVLIFTVAIIAGIWKK